MNQLNTKIDILEAKLDNMSMTSSGKEDLDKIKNRIKYIMAKGNSTKIFLAVD